ncbi:MAG: hypothetical protein JSR62_08220 [Nitrospira sp.]|nr:hypothetical protein [Nitrospira sp.]
MSRGLGSPLSFLLAGWGWVLLTSLLGLATFLSIVRGAPLPPGLRLLHVHGVLIGGLLQLMTGFALTASALVTQDGTRSKHRLLFACVNLSALGFTAAAWLRDPTLTMASGLLLAAAAVPIARHLLHGLRICSGWSPLASFFFGLSLLGLVGSLILGELLSSSWYPTWHGIIRLGHLHAGLLIFLTLAAVGAIQLTLPPLLHHTLSSTVLGQAVLLVLPACAAGLLTGFLLSSIPIQLVAGGCLLLTLALCCLNLLRTWSQAGQPGSAATDHLLTALCFLLIMTGIGMALGINVLWTPPALPYGTLHLVAYTHTAFLGFFLQAMVAGCAYALPPLLAAQRVPNQKKRGAYRDVIEHILNRWRAVQVATVSFGALGLLLVASLTWNLPLSSPWVQAATWGSMGLLLVHLTMVTVKLTQAVTAQPGQERAHLHDAPHSEKH